MAFPTLSTKPMVAPTPQRSDILITDGSEAGYEVSRPRYTKNRITFEVTHRGASQADVDALDAYFIGDAAHGSAIFSWTHPDTSATYNVRLLPVPQYTPHDQGNKRFFDITYKVKEA